MSGDVAVVCGNHTQQAGPALGQDSRRNLREFFHLPEDARSRRVGHRHPLVDRDRRLARTDAVWHQDIGDRVFQHQHRYEGRAQRTAAVARGGGVDQRAATVVEKLQLNDWARVRLDGSAALRHCLHLIGHRLGRVLDKVVHDVADLALHPWLL